MRTKKFFYGLLAIVMVAVTGAVLSSCSSSGDDDTDSAETLKTVSGTTWIGTDDGDKLTLTFTDGSSGTWVSTYIENGVPDTEGGLFTYKLTSSINGLTGVVNISYPDGETDIYTFVVSGFKMTIYEEDGDVSWILSKQ